jgi:hypothetical protein
MLALVNGISTMVVVVMWLGWLNVLVIGLGFDGYMLLTYLSCDIFLLCLSEASSLHKKLPKFSTILA